MRNNSEILIKKYLLMSGLLSFAFVSFSQTNDSIKAPANFGIGVTVTNKGISTIPNLTLGKPAAIFDLSIGRKKLSFEPQLRFALEGKPWSFLFWWRYKLVQTDKIRLSIGAHPALSFRTKTFIVDGVPTETMAVYRYLAGELSPVYILSKNVSVGAYYLYSRGIEKVLTRNTNMIALRSNFSNIKISEKFYLGFYPQVYYLRMDKTQGSYFNSSLTLARSSFPVTLSAMINKRLKSDLPGDNDFIWNVSLKYSFNRTYVE